MSSDFRKSSRTGVNRKFLFNTVRGLQAHNRREEEEDCWRQYRLEENGGVSESSFSESDRVSRDKDGDRSAPRREHCPPREATGTSSHDSRKFWAEAKARAMSSTPPEGHVEDSTQDIPAKDEGDTPDESRRPDSQEGKHRGKKRSREGCSDKTEADDERRRRRRDKRDKRDKDKDVSHHRHHKKKKAKAKAKKRR